MRPPADGLQRGDGGAGREPHPEEGDPFQRIGFLGLFGWLAAAVVALSGGLAALRAAGVVLSEPVVRNATLLLLYSALLLWLGRGFRKQGLDPRGFFRARGGWSRTEVLWLTALLIVFSLAATWVLHYPLIRYFPELAEGRLQSVEILTPSDAPGGPLFNAVEVAALVLLVPFAEELFFRGFLVNRWGRRWGAGTAVFASAALFSLLHVDLLGKLLFGVVLAILYLRTGSLVAPLVMHILNNAVAVGVILLAEHGPAGEVEAVLELLQTEVAAVAMVVLTGAPVVAWVVRRWPDEATSLPEPERVGGAGPRAAAGPT